MPYAAQSVLILLAPILFAASVYMYLGRIIQAVEGGESQSLIPTKYLTKIFVCGDILSFFVQGGGGGILTKATKQSTVNLGTDVILAGLVLQIVIFIFFVVVAAMWHVRMNRYTRATGSVSLVPWQRLVRSLYLASGLILVRNIVRCVEYGSGSKGYLLNHEWTTYAFDGLLMAIVLATCWLWYSSGVGGIRQGSVEGAKTVSEVSL